MSLPRGYKNRIDELRRRFEQLKRGKESLLEKIDQAEIPENVYNSNAIENSTLTLKQTEQILLEMETDRSLDLREIFEAKNLARIMDYIRVKAHEKQLDEEVILLLHQMLITNIDDPIAGRFRKNNEYVRIGTHVAPPPEHVEQLIRQLFVDFSSDSKSHFLEKVSKFHLEFERIHPFCDGNGRIGRVIMNYQLIREGFPPVIIRNKGKRDNYYPAFREYTDDRRTTRLDRLSALAGIESLHKRLAYLENMNIIRLADYAAKEGESVPAVLNSARRQTIPAFREKNVWKIGVDVMQQNKKISEGEL